MWEEGDKEGMGEGDKEEEGESKEEGWKEVHRERKEDSERRIGGGLGWSRLGQVGGQEAAPDRAAQWLGRRASLAWFGE